MPDKKWLVSGPVLFRIAQWACIGLFLGRSWQHLFWDAPYRALLWDESWMSGLVSGVLGMSWEAYASSDAVSQAIEWSIVATGVFYALCALAAWGIRWQGRVAAPILQLGGACLFLLSLLYYKDQFFFLGQLLEYALSWFAPFLLVSLWRHGRLTPTMRWLGKVAIALTFVCHGLYALGYYPRPVVFVQMVLNILPLDNASAATFLHVAGILDIVAAVLLFLPVPVLVRAGLWYCVVWGLLTSLARLVAFVRPAYWDTALHQWLHEALLRLPHFLVPLFLLLWIYHRASGVTVWSDSSPRKNL